MWHLKKYSWHFFLSLFTFIILGLFITRGYTFPVGNHYTHVPQIKSMLNPELYTNDYYVQEMLKFTPRYYYQYLVYFFSKVTGSISLTYFIYYLISFISFIWGLSAISKIFTPSKLSAAILIFLSLTAYTLVGYLELFPKTPIPATFAMSLTVWGIYFCFRQRWIIGYLFFGIASILQFLVGVLPGIMMIPIMFIEAIKSRQLKQVILPLIILFGFASLVYLPMVLTGTTSTDKLSNEEFVFIYGWVRNPHHIIPAYWNWKIRLDFICFILGGCLCIHKVDVAKSEDFLHKSEIGKIFFFRASGKGGEVGKIKEITARKKDLIFTNVRCLEKWKLYLIIAESIFALFLGYIFVEIYPLALFAKLQLARTVPFAQLMIFIAVGILVNQLYKQGNLGFGLLLIISLILPVPYQGICFFILSLGLFFLEKWSYKLVVWLIVLTELIFYLWQSQTDSSFHHLLAKLSLLLVLIFPFILDEVDLAIASQYLAVYSLAGVTTLVFILGLFEALPGKFLEVFQQQVKFNIIPQDEVTKLALRFRQISDKDDIILIPPFVSNFQFFSERAVIVDFKHFPQTDSGIREWKNRMEDVFGVDLNDKLAVGAMEILFPQQTGKELVNVGKKYGAEYILTRVEWHGDIEGNILAREGEWVIFRINFQQ
ncbi:MAG: hypothetical protein F6K18_20155 [Okeania sp. SIO2C2]|uniref:DUF6798 domain-containing protein n=1 Tax=Okeania sp. SIO2C2 TaxID=2607787 RepID=UPI0013BC5C8C|nr:DUF6798 domain-containing protein [Okeania sp. SIO2C2]NEP88956.1 hypothetical protein [Okeania sp. SIO2C2]